MYTSEQICKGPCPQVAHSLLGGRETKYVVNYVTHMVNYVLEVKVWYENQQLVEQELGKGVIQDAVKNRVVMAGHLGKMKHE